MFWEALYVNWGIPRSWKVQGEVVVIALNRKVVDTFLKVSVEWEGARQGTQPLCPVSPLLPQEVEHGLPPFLHQWNMICVGGEPASSTAIASPIGYLTAS